MSAENLNLLKSEVERIVGRKVLTASDCQYLSNDIYQQIKLRVSLNTLRRFFHLMTSKYQPSSFTLNLLSKYCGFSSFEEFIAHKERLCDIHTNSGSDLLNFLILLFKDFETKGVEDITYINLIHEIISNLEKWPQVIDEFQSQIAKTANGQFFYYEQFINTDNLNGYYGDGLRYYLHEKKDPQAQIFGHSLLCFRSWLSMNGDKVYSHCEELMKYKIDESIHPSICGRYFASQLYKAEYFDYDVEPIILAAREFYLDTKYSRAVSQGFPHYEFILAESLILIGQHEEALFYIIEATKKRNNSTPPYVHLKLFESIYLFHAIALKNTGKVEKAKEMLEMINVKNFYFLARKFNLILYLLQKQSFHKRDLLREQLDHLVQQTGFRKLVEAYPEIGIPSVQAARLAQ
ncbi:MAG: hypothetical protein EOP48_07660 [Sphingobacteriales bacterium]|nr:MAG: hypothetical protein EOP48_07660 [Sphingobacteriales bacterium]